MVSFFVMFSRDTRLAATLIMTYVPEWVNEWELNYDYPFLPRIAPCLLILLIASLVHHAKLGGWAPPRSTLAKLSPILVAIVASCVIVLPVQIYLSSHQVDPSPSLRLWYALFNSSYRLIYVVVFSWAIIMWSSSKKHESNPISEKKNKTDSSSQSWSILAPCRRLSFPFLMTTFLPGTFLLGIYRQPFFFSQTHYILLSFPSFFICLGLAVFIHLFFEAPIEQMIKHLSQFSLSPAKLD